MDGHLDLRAGRRRIGAAAGLLLVLAVAAPGSVAAGGGNSAAAHRCQMGGWQTLQDASGAAFASQSACVSYAASGGALFLPTLRLSTTTGTGIQFGGHYLLVDFAGTGFSPNSSITFTTRLDSGFTFTTTSFHPATDGSGAFTFSGAVLVCELVGLGAGDAVAGTTTATDTQGVHASAALSGTCSS